MAVTSDRLIAGVNRRISRPTSQGLLQASDILAFCDDIIQGELIPILEASQQDYFVEQTFVPLVSGQSSYNIPYRSVARGLREIKITDNGEQFYRNLPLIDIADVYQYSNGSVVCGFYFEGDKIKLVPNVPSSLSTDQKLAIWYRLPPNKMVEYSDVSEVVSIASNVVTVNAVPATMTGGVEVDFIQSKSGNSIYSFDVSIQSVDVGLSTITFASSDDVPTNLQSGDYICLSGESYVINFIPNEAYPLIETLTSRRCLQAISDYEGLKIIELDYEREKTNLKTILEPRIDGESKIIVNYTGISRGSKHNQRSWLYGQ